MGPDYPFVRGVANRLFHQKIEAAGIDKMLAAFFSAAGVKVSQKKRSPRRLAARGEDDRQSRYALRRSILILCM
jgi:hypothetical protein